MAKLLLIEPDRLLADTYRQGFIAQGHSVVMCASAQAAIFAADEVRPDIVILELQLIGHSGIEFLYEFRSYSEWQDIPVLIHSQVPPAEFTDSWINLKEQMNIAGYLYKSTTTFAALCHTLRSCINSPSPIL